MSTGTEASASGRSLAATVVGEVAGFVVLMYGAFIVLLAWGPWLSIRAPGVTVGPPSYVQWWNAQFVDGLTLVGFGVVLVVGSTLLLGIGGKRTAASRPGKSAVGTALVLMAIALVALAAVAIGLPSPQRTASFTTSDFVLKGLPGNPPYDYYFVSVPFEAHAGEVLLPLFNLTATDNRTGALEYWNSFASTWYTTPSEILNWRNASAWAWETVVPQDGLYVLWVRYDLCATPVTTPCNNYTAAVRGNLSISAPLAFQPWLFGLGLSGCVAMGGAVVQSGLGRRRTTS